MAHTVFEKALELGYGQLDADGGKAILVETTRAVYANRFLNKDGRAIFVGYDRVARKFIVEEEGK